jgi:C-terminal processing protease CtpA/Prc
LKPSIFSAYWLRSPEGTLEVIDVIVGSPAAEKDILPDDTIITFNGQPVSEMTDDEIWSPFTRSPGFDTFHTELHGNAAALVLPL